MAMLNNQWDDHTGWGPQSSSREPLPCKWLNSMGYGRYIYILNGGYNGL